MEPAAAIPVTWFWYPNSKTAVCGLTAQALKPTVGRLAVARRRPGPPQGSEGDGLGEGTALSAPARWYTPPNAQQASIVTNPSIRACDMGRADSVTQPSIHARPEEGPQPA